MFCFMVAPQTTKKEESTRAMLFDI